jgi:hypothetical protein
MWKKYSGPGIFVDVDHHLLTSYAFLLLAVDRWAVLLLAALVTFPYRLSKVSIKGAKHLSRSAHK